LKDNAVAAGENLLILVEAFGNPVTGCSSRRGCGLVRVHMLQSATVTVLRLAAAIRAAGRRA
jgi:hypothetical protein